MAARLFAYARSTLASSVRRTLLLIAAVATAFVARADAAEIRQLDQDGTGLVMFEIRGTIATGDTNSLQQLVGRLGPGRAVAVNLLSDGGLVDEALHLGRYMHANNIGTYVKGTGARCLSACALSFLGGRNERGETWRVKGSRALIGYHAFRKVEEDREYTVADMQRATAHAQDTLLKIADYLVAVEADIEFMSMMLEAPNQEMNYLANDKATKFGVHVLDERNGRMMLADRRPGR